MHTPVLPQSLFLQASSRHAPLSTLAYIVLASLAGGVLSIIAAAGTLTLHPSWISRLVSFAVGALLGAVFLELLPHAIETGSIDGVMTTVLIGLLAFFLLEKFVLWRHSHEHGAEAPDSTPSQDHDARGRSGGVSTTSHTHSGGDHGRSGLMILIGNSVHNFCDGVVIAASFLTDSALGIAATLAIVSHAIPQQVGDFAVLLHSGYARRNAFGFNLATGTATLVGALCGYYALAGMQQALPTVLAVAAASLLYVAVADLIPSLHRRPEPLETVKQLALIGLGIGVILAAHLLLAH
jgi:zinc and cadmium transporter